MARIPRAKRLPVDGPAAMAGFDNGDWQYDPCFTQWSQGASAAAVDGKRTAANLYNLSFWQYIDISYFFGHQLLTVPPLVWTNAAHKNGVVSLGALNLNGLQDLTTFMQDPAKVAATLTDIVRNYGFEGYLINYEESLPVGPALITLTKALRSAGLVTVWYESPISGGYANRMNPGAIPFYEAAGIFQANYWWGRDPTPTRHSKALIACSKPMAVPKP